MEQEQPPLLQSVVHAAPAPATIPNGEVQRLRDKVTGLRATVEALQQQVLTGDRQYAAQEERTALLATEIQALRRLVLSFAVQPTPTIITAQPTPTTIPVDAQPSAQSVPAVPAQPTAETHSTDVQPSAEVSSAGTPDLSVPLVTDLAGPSTEDHIDQLACSSRPPPEATCLPITMKATEADM